MDANFGPHRWSAGEYDEKHTDAYHGADFTVRDLRGARFVDCDMCGVKIVDALLVDVDISGYVQNFVVNGVDVTEYVADELDRRHPERVQLRQIRTAADHRAMLNTVDRLWAGAMDRAGRLDEAARQERVDGE